MQFIQACEILLFQNFPEKLQGWIVDFLTVEIFDQQSALIQLRIENPKALEFLLPAGKCFTAGGGNRDRQRIGIMADNADQRIFAVIHIISKAGIFFPWNVLR